MKVGDKVIVNPRLHECIWCIPIEEVKGKIMTIRFLRQAIRFVNRRGFEAYCCVKESGYIFKLDMFIPAEGTLFLAIYERRQHEERR